MIFNLLLHRTGPVAAILGTSCGFGPHLLPLFWAGLTYTCERAYSGSLAWAIVAHCLVNAAIFLPKGIVAIVRFRYC